MKKTNVQKIASEIISAIFPSQEALNKYLKEHPDADKSNHRVVKSLGKSENRIKFINNKEMKDAKDFLEKKMKGLPYQVDDDDKHIHFPNYKSLQDAMKLLKDKKKDMFIQKVHSK